MAASLLFPSPKQIQTLVQVSKPNDSGCSPARGALNRTSWRSSDNGVELMTQKKGQRLMMAEITFSSVATGQRGCFVRRPGISWVISQ